MSDVSSVIHTDNKDTNNRIIVLNVRFCSLLGRDVKGELLRLNHAMYLYKELLLIEG